MESEVKIKIDNKELDETVEKANQLVECLKEAKQIIDSLSGKEEKEYFKTNCGSVFRN